ncbi:MAG: DUF4870 domain-containing protein [Tumebacillaceae bacterium]
MELLNKEERTFGMLCHLAALAGFVIPFGNIIGPLVVWLLKRESSPFINEQGKEALNFQISYMIYIIISIILCLLLVGFILLFVIGIAELILVIIAAVKANEGVSYRYPLTIRFIK